MAVFAVACHSDVEHSGVDTPAQRAIVLRLWGGELGVETRAEDMADEAHEYAIKHLDVVIFNDAADQEGMTWFYHERIATAGPDGTVRLGINLDEIEIGAKYWVYVVANSTADASVFAAQNMPNVKSLMALTQQDYNLHLTATGLQNTPSHFLMDGVAYMGENEPSSAAAVTIAEEQIRDVVTLNVKLRRAAAKVVVKLMTGDLIQFTDAIEGSTPGYYMRNTPFQTRIIDDGILRQQENLGTTHELMSNYYRWLRDAEGNIIGVELTLYVYSHLWETSDTFDYATNLLVDVPAYYYPIMDGARSTVAHPDNYYQVPLTKEFKFERNHYYEVTANVHAPGAEDFSEPVVVGDLKYSVLPWSERNVEIGGEQGPEYLKVNLDELKMYNTDIDAESLLFSSSSPVTITVEDCYFIDKFGVQQDITSVDAYNIAGSALSGAISGNITVTSDLPTNNTIRYFTLKVVNQTGQVEYVKVEQYPLVYIVNILGHYSYRGDFRQSSANPTTYYHEGDGIVSLSMDTYDRATATWSYDYLTTPPSGNSYWGGSGGFWSSKVVQSTYPSTDNQSRRGRSVIKYYSWSSQQDDHAQHGNTSEDPGNARMYHIRLTATSATYKLGIPRQVTNDYVDYYYTDSEADNATLVSPSFMTASRLGMVDIQNYGDAFNTGRNVTEEEVAERRYAMARDHCANYAEVDQAGNVYDNWRLPTAAELQIIIDLQGTANESADAIDYLLNADYYMSASGLVYNRKNSDNSGDNGSYSQWAIRCVRDAY